MLTTTSIDSSGTKSGINLMRSIKGQLLLFFLAVALIPLAAASLILYNQARVALEHNAIDKLEMAQELKKGEIETYFAARQADLQVLVGTMGGLRSAAFQKLGAVEEIKRGQIEDHFAIQQAQLRILKDDPYVREAMLAFDAAFEEAGDSVDSAQWRTLARQYDARIQDMVADNGWYDLFLIHTDGDIVYTAAHESDLGMIIPDSELANSGLGVAFTRAQTTDAETISIGDFAPYAPSNGEQAAFMMAQMRDESGDLIGYVAFQISMTKINAIVQERTGMGESGETYLVAQEPDGRITFRSDLLTMGDGEYVVGYDLSAIAPDYIHQALSGTSGEDIYTDSAGKPVLVSYAPLSIEGVNWAIVAKIDAEEALAPQVEGTEDDFLTFYNHTYGYYDLFLINAEGAVFYSVAREADYGTNMLTGPYRDSNLGQLTAQVLESGAFGFADFAPYAPSNGDIASFIAAPLVHNGATELVVALQLSNEAINKVMLTNTGMGETGETILIGPDKRMRSDSRLDASHSVVASFAGTVEANGVDTAASRAALAGESGTVYTKDYRGMPAVITYDPLDVYGETWVINGKMDESEIFAASNSMLTLALLVLGLAAIIVAVIAWFIAASLAKPVQAVAAVARQVADIDLANLASEMNALAQGDLTRRFTVTAQAVQVKASNEIGQMAQAFNAMISRLQETGVGFGGMVTNLSDMVGQIRTTADGVSEASVQLNVAAAQSGEATQQIAQTMGQVAEGNAQLAQNVDRTKRAVAEQVQAIESIATGAQRQTQAVDEAKRVLDGRLAQAIQGVSVAANQNAQVTNEVGAAAASGQVAVHRTIEGIEAISQATEQVATRVAEMGERSRQIGQIVETINAISERTNLLALNAAIEAARAGEHGKGFAVVADEVRKLAEQSTRSTSEIAVIVKAVQDAAAHTVAAMETGRQKVGEGIERAGEAQAGLERIHDGAERTKQQLTQLLSAVADMEKSSELLNTVMARVAVIVEENTAAAEQSAASSDQVLQAMAEISSVSEENSASAEQVSASSEEVSAQVEETGAAAESLSQMARELQALVSQFQLEQGSDWVAAEKATPAAVPNSLSTRGKSVQPGDKGWQGTRLPEQASRTVVGAHTNGKGH